MLVVEETKKVAQKAKMNRVKVYCLSYLIATETGALWLQQYTVPLPFRNCTQGVQTKALSKVRTTSEKRFTGAQTRTTTYYDHQNHQGDPE